MNTPKPQRVPSPGDYDDANDILCGREEGRTQLLLDLIERIARRVRGEEQAAEKEIEVDGRGWGRPGERLYTQAECDRRVAEAVQRREVATGGHLREALRTEYERGRRQAADDLQDASEALRAEGHHAGREEMLKEILKLYGPDEQAYIRRGVREEEKP